MSFAIQILLHINLKRHLKFRFISIFYKSAAEHKSNYNEIYIYIYIYILYIYYIYIIYKSYAYITYICICIYVCIYIIYIIYICTFCTLFWKTSVIFNKIETIFMKTVCFMSRCLTFLERM